MTFSALGVTLCDEYIPNPICYLISWTSLGRCVRRRLRIVTMPMLVDSQIMMVASDVRVSKVNKAIPVLPQSSIGIEPMTRSSL